MTIHTTPINLPLLDLSRFNGSAEERGSFIEELRRTLHDHGFSILRATTSIQNSWKT